MTRVGPQRHHKNVFLGISSRMLDDLILNVHHLPERDLLYNSQVILNCVLSSKKSPLFNNSNTVMKCTLL
jgi:hypothetical protein